MKHEIKQSFLTPELQSKIFKIFSEHAKGCTGIDGFNPKSTSFEIWDNSNLIGCLTWQLFWGQFHIKYLVVEEQYRGQGIGRKLMDHALEYAKAKGCTMIYLETMNFQAVDFYEKLGFKTELIRTGFDKGTSFYYMKKDL